MSASPRLTKQQLRDARDVAVARKMFIGGCFLLPWLWILLMLHYRKRAFDHDAPPMLKTYLRYSAIGLAIVTVLVAVWIGVFQSQWQKWGATGLNLLVWQPPAAWWLT